MSLKILVVDDEQPVIDMLTYNLERAQYAVIVAGDGEQALAMAQREQPDLIILDLMLPQLEGVEVCRALRTSRCQTPIIMLTARDEEIDRVLGLELGADDYVVKPFSVRELLARVKAVLRRTQPPAQSSETLLRVGELTVDKGRYEAHLKHQVLDLTTLEFETLYVLALNAEHVLSREQLLEQVWGYAYLGDQRVVDAVIKRLRGKLREAAPGGGKLTGSEDTATDIIVTVRGVGYKLEA
jgi:two-component system, OmpR family, alkaline phosphatase synthesis response regulator PhoP